MSSRFAKVVLGFFVLFLIGLVVLADSGRAARFFAAVQAIPGGDKFGHFILFGTLSFLVVFAGQGKTTQVAGFAILKGSLIVMTFVTLEEVSQLFFRSRTFDLLDLVSDALGIYFFGRLAVACLEFKRRALQPRILECGGNPEHRGTPLP